MQAEVSAAREAQKRLMPISLPRTPYFSIAASCLPAFEVGGDFYDLFEMGPGKIGVLIAEGGGKGLGSALSIAFAKGFLMPKIMGERRSDDSPGEIIYGLQDRLTARIAEKEAVVGIAYAVIDASDGTLRYARTADYPSILVGTSNALVRPEEKERRFVSKLGTGEAIRLIEGSFSLQPGDSLILFTDGIARTWTGNGSAPDADRALALRRPERRRPRVRRRHPHARGLRRSDRPQEKTNRQTGARAVRSSPASAGDRRSCRD